MPPTIVRADQVRTTETPNAVMRTLASPTLSGTAGLSMWRVDMAAGQVGPHHRMSTEQVWTVLTGNPVIEVEGDDLSLAEGDTVLLPAGARRRVRAQDGAAFMVSGEASAVAVLVDADGAEPQPAATPPWIR